MKKRKKIQALLVSMVMSVTLLPSVVLAAQEGIPSVACEVTEDCILE